MHTHPARGQPLPGRQGGHTQQEQGQVARLDCEPSAVAARSVVSKAAIFCAPCDGRADCCQQVVVALKAGCPLPCLHLRCLSCSVSFIFSVVPVHCPSHSVFPVQSFPFSVFPVQFFSRPVSFAFFAFHVQCLLRSVSFILSVFNLLYLSPSESFTSIVFHP